MIAVRSTRVAYYMKRNSRLSAPLKAFYCHQFDMKRSPEKNVNKRSNFYILDFFRGPAGESDNVSLSILWEDKKGAMNKINLILFSDHGQCGCSHMLIRAALTEHKKDGH